MAFLKREVRAMSEDAEHIQATERVRVARDVEWHLITFVVVNAFFVLVWWINGGGFWPVVTLVFWGVGLGLHVWYVSRIEPLSDDALRREFGHHEGDTL